MSLCAEGSREEEGHCYFFRRRIVFRSTVLQVFSVSGRSDIIVGILYSPDNAEEIVVYT